MTLRNGVLLLLLAAGLAVLVLLREVLLIAFLAILVATLLSFPIGLLSRWMPRGLAVVVVIVLGAGMTAGIGYAAYIPVSEQVSNLTQQIPAGVHRMQAWLTRAQKSAAVKQITDGKSAGETVKEKAGDVFDALFQNAGLAALSLTSILSALVVIIVLGAFFVHEPQVYRTVIRALLPVHAETAFDELWIRLGRVLRSWVGGILVSMAIMGSVTAIGLLLAGIENWHILGFLTFLGTFVPYVGAIASGIPGLILALAQSTQHFVAAMGVYLLVHVIEGYIVEPMVMKRAVVIHPGTLLVWQLIMGTLFGVLGIMVATPLLACLKVALGYLYVERKLGKQLTAI